MARSSHLNAVPNLLLMITPLHFDQDPCHFSKRCGLLGSIGTAHHSAQYNLKTGKKLKHISNPTKFLSKKNRYIASIRKWREVKFPLKQTYIKQQGTWMLLI